MAGVPGIQRSGVGVDPNLDLAITIQPDHLLTDPYAAILAHKPLKGLEDLHK